MSAESELAPLNKKNPLENIFGSIYQGNCKKGVNHECVFVRF